MMGKEVNDLYYVCSLIEYIGRATNNTVADVVKMLGKDGIRRQLEIAETSHCLSFEEVADEVIHKHHITCGNFDNLTNCEYNIPTVTSIGGVYRDLILDIRKPEDDMVDILWDVYQSFISHKISDFNASTFFENPSYLLESYRAGRLLEW